MCSVYNCLLFSGMMVWSAITTGKGLGREEITGLFAKSRFNRKYSTFSWCEEDLAVPEVYKYNYYLLLFCFNLPSVESQVSGFINNN